MSSSRQGAKPESFVRPKHCESLSNPMVVGVAREGEEVRDSMVERADEPMRRIGNLEK